MINEVCSAPIPPTSQIPVNAVAEDEIDLLEVFSILKAHWKILAAFVIVGSVVGFLFVSWLRPVFQSDVLLQIDVEGSKAGMAMGDMGALLDAPSPADAEIELIKSRMVLGAVVQEAHLCYSATPMSSTDRLLHKEGRMDLRLFSVPEEVRAEKWTARTTGEQTYELLSSDEKVLLKGKVGDTYHVPYLNDTIHFSVAFLMATPGQRFALSEVDPLIAFRNLSAQLSVSEKGKKTGILQMTYANRYSDRAASILNTIANAYVRQNVAMLSAEAEKTLLFLEGQLPALRMKLDSSEKALTEYRHSVGTVDLTGEARVVLEKQVDLQQQLLTLARQKQEMTRLFKEDHPSVIAISEQEATLRKEMGKVAISAKELPLTQQEVIKLQEDVNINNALYSSMLNNIQELRVVRAGEIGNVRIVDYASHEIFPIKPRRKLILAGILLGSFILGAGFIFLLRMTMRGVRSSSEIERDTGVSVYAKIPESEHDTGSRKKGSNVQTLMEADPDDFACEALRTLRTALDFSFLERGQKVLVITGLLPSVGKSFVSENLSVLFAGMKKNVLLIDADLRRGRISHRNKKGLTDVLHGHASLDEIIEKKNNGGISVLGAGSIPTNPSELLASDMFANIIAKVRENYDLIVIDTPPILLVTDAQLVCKYADFALMIVRYGAHNMEAIKEGMQLIDRSGIHNKAIVLNRCQYEGGRYGYGYGYRYRYHGKYGYKPSVNV
ncbi:MAG: polysaccharide biosynthesis tyrosine autokinase [Fibrobacteraceae bacterium]